MKRILKTLLPICLLIIVVTVAIYYRNDYLREKQITEANGISSVNTDYADSPPEEEEEWIDWQEADWEDEEYQPEIRPFNFGFLWDDPQDDQDSIRAALTFAPEVVFNVMGFVLGDVVHEGRGHYKEIKGKSAYFTIMKYLYDFRAKADLPSITEAYIHLLPAYFSRHTYVRNWISQVVDELLISYNAIYESDDPLEGLSAIYNTMLVKIENEKWQEREARCYRTITQYTNAEEYLDIFERTYHYGKEGDEDYQELTEVDYGRLIWAYSFWGRRYNEGIHQDVHYVLKRIYELYENSEEFEKE